jgi:hypothetical protein
VADIKDAWGRLRASQAWVNRQKKISAVNPTRAALAEATILTLAMLPWGLAKRGVSDSEPFHTLSRLLGPTWLAGSQMNDMLDLLGNKINMDPDLVKKTRVWGTALVPKILEAFRATNDETYWTARDLRWLRDVGDDLVQKKAALITSAHLGPVTNEPHWVAVVFDCRDETVVRRLFHDADPRGTVGCLPLVAWPAHTGANRVREPANHSPAGWALVRDACQ